MHIVVGNDQFRIPKNGDPTGSGCKFHETGFGQGQEFEKKKITSETG